MKKQLRLAVHYPVYLILQYFAPNFLQIVISTCHKLASKQSCGKDIEISPDCVLVQSVQVTFLYFIIPAYFVFL